MAIKCVFGRKFSSLEKGERMKKYEKTYSDMACGGLEQYEYKGRIPYRYYGKLLDIAKENNLVTFDINDVISFVIQNFSLCDGGDNKNPK